MSTDQYVIDDTPLSPTELEVIEQSRDAIATAMAHGAVTVCILKGVCFAGDQGCMDRALEPWPKLAAYARSLAREGSIVVAIFQTSPVVVRLDWVGEPLDVDAEPVRLRRGAFWSRGGDA